MWPSRPTAIGWPARVGMAECAFGISTTRTRRSSRLRHTAEQPGPWPFRPMVAPWPPEATMPRSSSGTWLLFSKPRRCAGTPDRSMDWPFRETGPFWPVAAATAQRASGARRRSKKSKTETRNAGGSHESDIPRKGNVRCGQQRTLEELFFGSSRGDEAQISWKRVSPRSQTVTSVIRFFFKARGLVTNRA